MSKKFESNRDEILRISAELFAKSGYHGTGISDLGAAVGLGRGALYHYIGSKETILYEISSRQLAQMNNLADELALTEKDPEKRLRGLARALLRNIAEHRAEWTVFFREYHALTGERRDRVIAARERYEAHWRNALDQGVRDGQFRPLPTLMVKGLLGMFNYSYLWLTLDGPESPEDIADEFLDTVLVGMNADGLRS
ncbi:TetR/AcrR family transcriptional regulator [Mycolicibacterium smegmatis]|uniref:Transcriptional regulator, TetR family protein n=3 Tax=Mycolicibacterium smegmatis TaxID=1772 RepID=A0QQD2_MYCS2|nr:TetR/AcrR family transcriptional regulator [Mycolicibacterium smegmatis]ABK70480.1 transcriptional regulator, TetR family protein [Mycolicibacterium smegmatis MC2 155]AFP37176.1 Transcriptional regulator, TetR family [Mycolicibacterium smegmatis MC2 155]AIU05977.1 TetR family transcriptional regulator [Mycolicibacterium smegmatis MC2 155]AIU12602.1 TetR family transcriptional regulator [Mycolicibacterium smegmatis]AIU19226.1 TetR family transcriptional regulator [Mycolicibacterium smegmatis